MTITHTSSMKANLSKALASGSTNSGEYVQEVAYYDGSWHNMTKASPFYTGGDGTETYAQFEASVTASGSDIDVTQLKLHDGSNDFSVDDAFAVTVNDGDTLTVQWKVEFT